MLVDGFQFKTIIIFNLVEILPKDRLSKKMILYIVLSSIKRTLGIKMVDPTYDCWSLEGILEVPNQDKIDTYIYRLFRKFEPEVFLHADRVDIQHSHFWICYRE